VQVGDVVIEVNGTCVIDRSYFETTTLIASAGAITGAVVAFSLASAADFRERYGGADDSDTDSDDADADADADADSTSTRATGATETHGNDGTDSDTSDDDDARSDGPITGTAVEPADGGAATPGKVADGDGDVSPLTSTRRGHSKRRGSSASRGSTSSSTASPTKAHPASDTVGTPVSSPQGAPHTPLDPMESAAAAAAAAALERVVSLDRPKLGGLGLEIAPAGVGEGAMQVGVKVSQLKPGGVAAGAGVLVNDYILSVNGRPVAHFTLSQVGLEIQAAGTTIELTLVETEKILSGEYRLHWPERDIPTPASALSDDSRPGSPGRGSTESMSPKPSPMKAGLMAAWLTLKKNVVDTRSSYQLKQAASAVPPSAPGVVGAAEPDAAYAAIDGGESDPGTSPPPELDEPVEHGSTRRRKHSFRELAIAATEVGAKLAIGQVRKVKRSLSNPYSGPKGATAPPPLEGDWEQAQFVEGAMACASSAATNTTSQEPEPESVRAASA
jgi:hypothetical protein